MSSCVNLLISSYNGNQWQNQIVALYLSTLSEVSIQQQYLANGEVLTVNNGVWSNVAKHLQRIHFLSLKHLVKEVMLWDSVDTSYCN